MSSQHRYSPAVIFSPRIRLEVVFGVLAGLLCIGFAIYLAWALHESKSAPGYTPADVVYGEVLHAGPGNGQVRGQVGGGSPGEAGDQAPSLVIPTGVYDLGVIRSGSVVTRQAPLANRGEGVLEVLSAHTTCGCTTAEISAVEIPPGKVALVTIRFDSGFHDLRGQTVRRGVVIQTNDPHLPWAELWIQVRVQ